LSGVLPHATPPTETATLVPISIELLKPVVGVILICKVVACNSRAPPSRAPQHTAVCSETSTNAQVNARWFDTDSWFLLKIAMLPVQHRFRHEEKMAETRISIVDALRGQQDQLKRLIAQKFWISDAPKATLSEIESQLSELRRLITQLETDIQDQLKGRSQQSLL
jgi:hypothetical protein